MADIPVEHIADSHLLVADARIDLFELTPSDGAGVIRFKNDNTITWRGTEYTGFPVALTGEKKSIDDGVSMPQMTLGNGALDLSPFKGLVNAGHLDNAIILKQTLLLDNLLNNRLIRESSIYRVKRVVEYSRIRIRLQLATLSDSLGFSMPYRTYLPPGFSSVQM